METKHTPKLKRAPKNTAHNELEVKTLIKEAFSRGDEERYNGMNWFKHDSNELICTSEIKLTEFTLHQEDGSSLTVAV